MLRDHGLYVDGRAWGQCAAFRFDSNPESTDPKSQSKPSLPSWKLPGAALTSTEMVKSVSRYIFIALGSKVCGQVIVHKTI